jgi:hypothetical protein
MYFLVVYLRSFGHIYPQMDIEASLILYLKKYLRNLWFLFIVLSSLMC